MLEYAIAGATFGLSGGLSPGPLLALVLAETVAHGRRAGVAVAASPLVTDGPIIALAVLLLGRIESSQPALGIVNLVGGTLLASYGIAAWRGGEAKIDDVEATSHVMKALGKGITVNLFNPSPYLFWLTIGAPVLVEAHDHSAVSAAFFLAVFYTGLVGSKSLLAGLVARSRRVLEGRAYLWTHRVLAVVLMVYAVLFVRAGMLRLFTA
jgi:threonine/homoserine/homoserine lactone efflux protein